MSDADLNWDEITIIAKGWTFDATTVASIDLDDGHRLYVSSGSTWLTTQAGRRIRLTHARTRADIDRLMSVFGVATQPLAGSQLDAKPEREIDDDAADSKSETWQILASVVLQLTRDWSAEAMNFDTDPVVRETLRRCSEEAAAVAIMSEKNLGVLPAAPPSVRSL